MISKNCPNWSHFFHWENQNLSRISKSLLYYMITNMTVYPNQTAVDLVYIQTALWLYAYSIFKVARLVIILLISTARIPFSPMQCSNSTYNYSSVLFNLFSSSWHTRSFSIRTRREFICNRLSFDVPK